MTPWQFRHKTCWILKSVSSRPGLANFNPLEGHKIREDSPGGRIYLYMYRMGGIVLTRTSLVTNMTFVFLLFIKVAILCFWTATLYLLKYIIGTIEVNAGRQYFPQRPHVDYHWSRHRTWCRHRYWQMLLDKRTIGLWIGIQTHGFTPM
jgi:hypothetical protein